MVANGFIGYSQEALDFIALGVFVDTEPMLFNSLSLPEGERMMLRPSDVTIATAMNEQLTLLLLVTK